MSQNFCYPKMVGDPCQWMVCGRSKMMVDDRSKMTNCGRQMAYAHPREVGDDPHRTAKVVR
jgi:hypothetical protein